MHPGTKNRSFTMSSDVDQGDPKQEQRERGKAEHKMCLDGDHRDGIGSHDEPHSGSAAAHERSESSRTGEDHQSDGRSRAVVGCVDARSDEAGADENPHEAEEGAEAASMPAHREISMTVRPMILALLPGVLIAGDARGTALYSSVC